MVEGLSNPEGNKPPLDETIRKIGLGKTQEVLKEFHVPEQFSLDISYFNVNMLLDFMGVLEKNSDQFDNNVTLSQMKRGGKPWFLLGEYILLEISNYYTKVYTMREKGIDLPEPPSYWNIIRDFRHQGPAHRDKKHELKNLGDYVGEIHKIDLVGMPKIVQEFLEYHKKIKTNFKLK